MTQEEEVRARVRSAFRVLLSIHIITTIVHWALPFIPYMELTPDAANLLRWDSFDALFALGAVPYWAILVIWIAATVGLWFFYMPARWLFSAVTLLSILMLGLGGTRVALVADSVLGGVFTLLTGAIFGLINFPVISMNFRND